MLINILSDQTHRPKPRSWKMQPHTWVSLLPRQSWKKRATRPRGRACRVWGVVPSARTLSRSPRWCAPPNWPRMVSSRVLPSQTRPLWLLVEWRSLLWVRGRHSLCPLLRTHIDVDALGAEEAASVIVSDSRFYFRLRINSAGRSNNERTYFYF